MLFKAKTIGIPVFRGVSWIRTLVALLAQLAVPNNDPVKPWVAIILPDTTNSSIVSLPLINNEPVITALPEKGKPVPVPPPPLLALTIKVSNVLPTYW